MSIYVEILMHTDLDKLWKYTQTPEVHARWDLRFSTIDYLPRPDLSRPQQFLYSTRIGFEMVICGKGETVGSREELNAARTSALKFWSEDPRSLIREGSGYWQYVPTPEGIRFLTRYTYQTRFGWPGYCFDRLVFRPLMGWATAWSFDRLRLWLEKDIDPTAALERSLVYATARLILAIIWIYQGFVPKLLYRDTGELNLLQQLRIFAGHEPMLLSLVGLVEILFGALLLWNWQSRWLLKINIAALLLLGVAALLSRPGIYLAPFNPLTLTLAMIALSVVGLISDHDLPSARSCRRQSPEEK